MSFFMTTPQMRAKSKDVTRRLGWWKVKPGEILLAVEKGQGLKKGEKVVPIGPIRIVDARPERLDAITQDDCRREGFPEMTPRKFIEMFSRHNGCAGNWPVNRIEFEFV